MVVQQAPLSDPITQVVERHVRCDTIEPGAQLSAALELIAAVECPDEGVLSELLGHGFIPDDARHAPQDSRTLIEE